MPASDEPETDPFVVSSSTPDKEKFPDLGRVTSSVLYEGPLSRKEIIHREIYSRDSGEFKGHEIQFRTFKKSKGELQKEPSKSLILDTKDQIQKTLTFITETCGDGLAKEDGKFLLVPTSGSYDLPALQRTISQLSQENKTSLLMQLLEHATRTPDLINVLIEQVVKNPELFSEAAATLNLARYQKALAELKELIATSAKEPAFQKLLSKNPWMFGSEYSEKLTVRGLTVASQLDFVLRRTSDGFIEIIEIKTAIETELFRFDSSRHSHFAGRDLSEAVGQVQKYIEELDAGRYMVQSINHEDTNKIRAKIIIGRDHDEGQQTALRRFNGHLHRIEVITFDQLAKIAEQVVAYLEQLVPNHRVRAFAPKQIERGSYDLDDDIPF